MSTIALKDVMQVCRNGHVITDLMQSDPNSAQTHCDRCGAPTMERCLTCGAELPGAVVLPGYQPVGLPQPPAYCSGCGAAFPWTRRPTIAPPASLARLETLLHGLPKVIRQLRARHGDRPPFRVVDEFDLEDLLRAMLPIHFEDIRPQSRTPRYAAATRTDFLLATEEIVVNVKLARPTILEPKLAEQLLEDAAYHRQNRACKSLVCCIYDPDGLLRDTATLRATCGATDGDLEVRCVVPGSSSAR